MPKRPKRQLPWSSSSNMWRDPASVRGKGCLGVVIVGMGIVLSIPLGIVSLFI